MPTHDASAAAARRQRAFLERYVFRGLGGKRVAFDASTIPHFAPVAFLQVLDRCQRFSVHVYGVEIFSRSGEAIHMQLSSDGSPYALLPSVMPFVRFEDVTVCASFGVPASLLATPAISRDLVDAYTASEYHVRSNDHIISIRVGERSAELEGLLRDRSATEAYLLTACSPFSFGRRNGDDAETAALRIDLERAGVFVLPAVAAGGTAWEEEGFLAISLSEADARRFGDGYGQNALLRIEADGMAELMLLR